jgi:hypothetical protein
MIEGPVGAFMAFLERNDCLLSCMPLTGGVLLGPQDGVSERQAESTPDSDS